jgi:hypothetical protein
MSEDLASTRALQTLRHRDTPLLSAGLDSLSNDEDSPWHIKSVGT